MIEETQQGIESAGGSTANTIEQSRQQSGSTPGQHPPPPLQFASTQPEFRSLDPRVIKLWRMTNLIGWGVILIVSLISAIIVGWGNPELVPWVYVGWLVLLVLCGWLIYRRPPRLYRSWGYRIDDRVLETRSGLLFQVTRLLPLTRIQHVDLQRGPLERTFGLASLVLHTAGTHEATIRIPGLEAVEAVELRDHLVAVGGDDAV